MISQPSRFTFWRLILAITALLSWVSLRDALNLAKALGISPLVSKTWLVLIAGLVITGGVSLILPVMSFFHLEAGFAKLIDVMESASSHSPASLWKKWLGWALLILALITYPLFTFHPYYGELLNNSDGVRLFIFWLISLTGMFACRLAIRNMNWASALLTMLLLQANLLRIALYLPDISAYPFSMGWSETSRFYYPALFYSKAIFGQSLPWPILHPTLHFTLLPPYLFNAPLWFHRLWQVFIRFLLVGLIAPALVNRVNLPSRSARWLVGVWIFLMLFTLPLYLHLAVPVFIILWGFSTHNHRRTWLWLAVASVWAGLSRINWYPLPGLLTAALFFLENPTQKLTWRSLLKPALWFLAGTLLAFLSMQIYIRLSGIGEAGSFFTSLSSPKLWERLWPNESYHLGVLPGIMLFSFPFWLAITNNAKKINPGRLGWLIAELAVLFAGGIVVSMKIGGGADIHNMDGYAVTLLIISVYMVFGPKPFTRQDDAQSSNYMGKALLPWTITFLLVLVPVWFSVQGRAVFWNYDPKTAQKTLAALQQQVSKANSHGGQVLFITQRHLISMHLLKGVYLIPEYEREDLMEMAMSKNATLLEKFNADIENHRFAAIIADPLRINYVSDQDAMGVENNAWTRYVIKQILCNYQQQAVFPADRIAIYVPQVGEQKCP